MLQRSVACISVFGAAALLALSVTPAASAQLVSPESEPAPEPSAEVQQGYWALVHAALAEFEAGRYAEANTLFLRAHELWPSARTQRVLGITAFELRRYVTALQALSAALVDTRKPLGDEHRREVERLIEQARAFVGRYRLRLSPDNAELLVDGNPILTEADGSLLLEFGTHELLVRAAGYAPLRRQLFVDGGDHRELVLELEPFRSDPIPSGTTTTKALTPEATDSTPRTASESASRSMALWPFTLGGAVVMGGAALTAFVIADAKAECNDMPPSYCSDSEISKIHTLDAISITLVSLSGVLLATTGVLLLAQPDTPAGLSIAVYPGYVSARRTF